MEIQKSLQPAPSILERGWEKCLEAARSLREKFQKPLPRWLESVNDYFVCLERTPPQIHPLVDRGDAFLQCLQQRQIERSARWFSPTTPPPTQASAPAPNAPGNRP